jgi:hypothetical protein
MAKPPRAHLETMEAYEEGLLKDGWYEGRPDKAKEAWAIIHAARQRESRLRRFTRKWAAVRKALKETKL